MLQVLQYLEHSEHIKAPASKYPLRQGHAFETGDVTLLTDDPLQEVHFVAVILHVSQV